jgi:hypothetical protein
MMTEGSDTDAWCTRVGIDVWSCRADLASVGGTDESQRLRVMLTPSEPDWTEPCARGFPSVRFCRTMARHRDGVVSVRRDSRCAMARAVGEERSHESGDVAATWRRRGERAHRSARDRQRRVACRRVAALGVAAVGARPHLTISSISSADEQLKFRLESQHSRKSTNNVVVSRLRVNTHQVTAMPILVRRRGNRVG